MSWRSDAFDLEQDQDLEYFEETESPPVLPTPWPFPAVNWLARPMLSVWWNVPTEKLESCSVLPSQFAKLAGATIKDRWYSYLARNIHTSSSRYRRYLWQKLSHFYAKIAWHQMLGISVWLVGSLFSRTGVRMSCSVSFSESILPQVTSVSYLKRSVLLLSAVYPTLSAVPPRRRVYRPIDTNLQVVSSLESINCLRRYTRNY